jgi:hypothetical protein
MGTARSTGAAFSTGATLSMGAARRMGAAFSTGATLRLGPVVVMGKAVTEGTLGIRVLDKVCRVGKVHAVESLSTVNKLCVVADEVPMVG